MSVSELITSDEPSSRFSLSSTVRSARTASARLWSELALFMAATLICDFFRIRPSVRLSYSDILLL